MPFFVWSFDENTGKWTNDAANWHQKWEIVNKAICLQNVAPEPEESWLSLEEEGAEEETSKASKALLWSPPIRKSIGIRCITMEYRINADLTSSALHSLSILQQQSG